MPKLSTSRVVVVDLEATCWGVNRPVGIDIEIIEIGICVLHIASGDITQNASFYVKPSSPISEYCTSLTGITQETIQQQGRPLHEVINSIKKEYPLKSCPWASWGDYDRHMFIKECAAKQIEYPFCDTHLNAKVLHAFFTRASKGVGLDAALAGFNISFVGRPHCGADDAFNTAVVLRRMWPSQ